MKAAYGVSWLYLLGDVSLVYLAGQYHIACFTVLSCLIICDTSRYETYKAKHNGPTALDLATGLGENSRLGMVAAKRGM